jgi:hypothetical protein
MPGGERQARFVGEMPDFDDVSQLMRLHGVQQCVVDALPETRAARGFQEKWRGRVWLAYYVAASKQESAVRLDADQGVVYLDRTRTLDAMFGLFAKAGRGEAGNTLPANARYLPDYYAHLKAPERRLTRAADGNQVAVYVESGPDHYAHAENYCSVALGQVRGLAVGWA